MIDKIGIIIKDAKAPSVNSTEIKAILSYFDTKSIDTIDCENIIEAKNIIKEKYEEISFIYLTSPIPNIEKAVYEFIEFITTSENYRHIEFFARMPKKQKKSKYKWYDDFINYVKL